MIIGITGKIGSGKTTAANYITCTGNFTKYAFSSPLKKMAMAVGFEKHQIYGTQEQKLEVNEFWGVSGRQFLQKFGKEVCRDFLPTVIPQVGQIWIQCFENYVRQNPGVNILVEDVRFLDEADAIKKMGGKIIRLIRGDEEKLDNMDGAVHAHGSEVEMDNIIPDVSVVNYMNGLNEWYATVDGAVEQAIRQMGN